MDDNNTEQTNPQGESAGSASVTYHLLSPLSQRNMTNQNVNIMTITIKIMITFAIDINMTFMTFFAAYFHQAIAESGSALSGWAFDSKPEQHGKVIGL